MFSRIMWKNTKISGLILAAGEGKRMKSDLPKVVHTICGKPLAFYPANLLLSLGIKNYYFIVGNQADLVKKKLGENENYLIQNKPLGTADAVKSAGKVLRNFCGEVIILYGDVPLITKETILNLIGFHLKSNSCATLITAEVPDPSGYGRIRRDREGNFLDIIEEKHADEETKLSKEINSGIYCFKSNCLFNYIEEIKPSVKTGEYYLTDIFKLFINDKLKVSTLKIKNYEEILGVNSREELAKAEKIMKLRIIKRISEAGVTFVDPDNTFVDFDVKIGRDSIVHPFTIIKGETTIGRNNEIGPCAYIEKSKIGNNNKIIYSHLENCVIRNEIFVGPFANLRPGTKISDKCKIGNFVELKKSNIKRNTKISHLSYIGDSNVGENVNIGAGTITCNFDGISKYNTSIGDGAFIGSDTILVAPVKIGKRSMTGAGSVITKNVPPDSLAIERTSQVNKLNWCKRKFQRRKNNNGKTCSHST